MGAEYNGEGAAPWLLDGATGTELERRGVSSPLPLWSAHALLEAPETLLAVHREYAGAGVDALTANTFRTQRRTLSRAGLGDRAAALTELAVGLARRAAEEAPRRVRVLGSAPPLEDCFRPDLVPGDRELAREHAEHARNLLRAGADAIAVETMNTIREAVAALRAARELSAEALVSFTCDAAAALPSGEPLARALEEVAPLRPELVGVNCVPLSALPACLAALGASGMPFAVQPNLGPPDRRGHPREDCTPEAFAAAALHWVRAGARALGGCCGTTPAHIAALRGALDGRADRGAARQA
jgi:S-methylmethionine-dependent homocysteine/selenocysteine methylase